MPLRPVFRRFFQVPYPVSPLLATLTKTAGVYTLSSQNETSERTPQASQQVRASCNRLRPLEKLQVEKRGWTLDVLQVVQSLGKLEGCRLWLTRHYFSLSTK